MALADYRCSVECDKYVRLEHCKGLNMVDISFIRTIRVPDNSEINYLPPNLGKFPLFKVKDYFDKLPASMVAKGGLFMPMYQREAMWINFEANQPFLVKIYCGGVNIVSGEYAEEDMGTKLRRQQHRLGNRSLQDYVVVPNQKWVDGIASKPGLVKQFVTMPVGQGYSVEAQVTGKETVGGLQIEITPARTVVFPRESPPGRFKITVSNEDNKRYLFHVKGTTRVGKILKAFCQRTGSDLAKAVLVFDGMRLRYDETFDDANITEGDSLFFCLEVVGGGGGGYCPPRPESMEMGVSVGGSIEQTISEDKYPPDTWHRELTTTFNVQIVNSHVFEQITGEEPPECPITSDLCAMYKLPFFDMYEEPSLIHGDFNNVKSVKEIDSKVDSSQKFKVVQLNPEGMRINKSYNHANQSSNEHVADPDDIVNITGTLRKFRTVHELAEEIDGVSVASFDSDETMS